MVVEETLPNIVTLCSIDVVSVMRNVTSSSSLTVEKLWEGTESVKLLENILYNRHIKRISSL